MHIRTVRVRSRGQHSCRQPISSENSWPIFRHEEGGKESNWIFGGQVPELGVKETKFPLTPMGVLSPGSAHARPPAWSPIDMSGNFPGHVSEKSPSNISPKKEAVLDVI